MNMESHNKKVLKLISETGFSQLVKMILITLIVLIEGFENTCKVSGSGLVVVENLQRYFVGMRVGEHYA